jgi:membrane-associated phospholipid phosphatase
MRKTAVLLAMLLAAQMAIAAPVQKPIVLNSSQKGIETAGTGIAIALPLVAAGISIDKDDLTGVAQMLADTLVTVGSAYALKHIVREERPDHSDFNSFPSDTAALAFAPAQFLWDRYGWEYGVPAYAAAVFVGYSRVDARKHHWYDVAASAGLAFVSSEIFTTEFHDNRRLSYSAGATPGGVAAQLSYRW